MHDLATIQRLNAEAIEKARQDREREAAIQASIAALRD